MTSKARRLVQNEDELLLQYIHARCKRDKKFTAEILLDLADIAKEQATDRTEAEPWHREQWLKKCADAWDWDPEKDELPE